MLVVVGVVTLPWWIRMVPMERVEFLVGRWGVVDEMVCSYPVTVGGESMVGVIESGEKVEMNKCFEEDEIVEGTVVMFKDESEMHLGIVRYVLPLERRIYMVSAEKSSTYLQSKTVGEIVAITNEVDVSGSRFVRENEVSDFILDKDKYLDDFYLARMRIGGDVDVDEIVRTNVFNGREDMFCMVVCPKEKMMDVEIAVLVGGEEIMLGEGMIFDTNRPRNVNCRQIGGEGVESIDLSEGEYEVELRMDGQILERLGFVIE